MLIFAELLDLLCEHPYLVFFTKHAAYFKISSVEISYSNKCVLKTSETIDRVQVASCVFVLPLTLVFFSCEPGPMY